MRPDPALPQDKEHCIICGIHTRSRGDDFWIERHGLRFCSPEHLELFKERYYNFLHTPSWYPKRRVMADRKKKEERSTHKIARLVGEMLPDVGTPEREKMIKEIKSLTTTNCWFLEYEIAKILKMVMSEFHEVE
jgi:hypothetical protein